MIPCVLVCTYPNAFPIAITLSPTIRSRLVPRGIVGNRSVARTLTSAKSLRGRVAIRSAVVVSPSSSVTRISETSSTTWWFVIT